MGEARRSFHQSLEELQRQIVDFANLIADGIPKVTEALLTSDLDLARSVIDADDQLDELSITIEESCLKMLALQQPMASDLRALVSAVKLNWELERTGDLVVNLGKVVRRIYGVELTPRVRELIEQMGAEAHLLTARAVEAYAKGDAALAAALDDMDDALDALQTEYAQTIIAAHERGEIDLQTAVQLAYIGRFYERIGDHAVNVGERIRYMVTGWLPEHTGAARAAARSKRQLESS
ncbi:MAG TPA: phosphate signaling complex protein PhoU [Acidimicrobiales bacterium]